VEEGEFDDGGGGGGAEGGEGGCEGEYGGVAGALVGIAAYKCVCRERWKWSWMNNVGKQHIVC